MNSTCELGRHAARALKPYPDYKDSAVPWLGKVPSHWAVRRIRTIAAVISGATPSSNTGSYWEGHIAWVTPQDLGALGSRYTTTSARRITRKGYEACGATMAPAGSVVISTRAPIGHTGILSSTACTNQGCRLLVPNGAIQPEHLYYSLKVARPELESLGQGTTFAELSRNELARFAVPVAPRREQAAIVRFLDHADRRIRRYIRAQQQLITLLEEQKQALIHQAVTRGLDPNVRLKPSGVEWLGDVPEHWEVRRLKWVTRLQRGYDLPADRRVPGPFPVVSSGGFIGTHSESRCAGPGVVMGRYGSTEAVFYVEQDFWPHNTSLFVTHFQGNTQKWCYYLLRSITKADHAGKSAVPGLDRNDLFQIVVPVPPVNEQREVVRMIEVATHDLNDAISAARREIDLLREYRTRLIADVVTGKLDVRAAAARLQDEVEELEPLDEADALIDGEDEPTDALATAP